jgi:hypothetical protein
VAQMHLDCASVREIFTGLVNNRPCTEYVIGKMQANGLI